MTEYTANIAFAGFTAPKILWVRENEPENFKRIKKIMLPKDYIAYKMTGIHSTDYSDASGMLLLDVKNKCWSKEMLKICGIDESVMPKLFESYDVIGVLKSEVAKELGIDVLGKLPLDPKYAQAADEGRFYELENPHLEAGVEKIGNI